MAQLVAAAQNKKEAQYLTAIMSYYLLFGFILSSAMILSVALKKLTVPAAFTGGLLGIYVFAGAGFAGIAMMGAFFILGTAATAFKKDWKQQKGLSETKEQQRTSGQVFANGGVAGLLGLLAFISPAHAEILQLLLAASLASATADTVSSELGMVYGHRFYNIRSLRKDTCGLDGAISWEGTMLGIAGSVFIALIFGVAYGFGRSFYWIIIAGTIGNLADSYLGATWERAHFINNNVVNFLNTLLAAAAALVLAIWF